MSTSLFNLYDYIFFAFMLFFVCVGLVRGFWIQLCSVIIWALGGIVYYYNAPQLEQVYLSRYLSIPVAHWFVLAIVLVGCFFINFLIRFLLGSVFKVNAFTFFNKVGGLFLGLVGSALIVALIIYAVNSSDMQNESSDWKKSYIVSNVIPTLDKLNEHSDEKVSLPGATATDSVAVSQVGNTMEVS